MKFTLTIDNNYKYAYKVGQKGKELTVVIINYNDQTKRIWDFINSINN